MGTNISQHELEAPCQPEMAIKLRFTGRPAIPATYLHAEDTRFSPLGSATVSRQLSNFAREAQLPELLAPSGQHQRTSCRVDFPKRRTSNGSHCCTMRELRNVGRRNICTSSIISLRVVLMKNFHSCLFRDSVSSFLMQVCMIPMYRVNISTPSVLSMTCSSACRIQYVFGYCESNFDARDPSKEAVVDLRHMGHLVWISFGSKIAASSSSPTIIICDVIETSIQCDMQDSQGV